MVLRGRGGESIRRVGFQPLDSGIESSHIGPAVSPVESDGAIPTMTPAGLALLMGHLSLAGMLVLRRRGAARGPAGRSSS